MSKRKKRRRVDRKKTASNASDQLSTGATVRFKLPKNVREWSPEQAGKIRIDILPYVVSIDNHPDRIEAGTVWYKYPFSVHRNVGIEKQAIVCPVSFGKACPICEERDRLAQHYDDNKDAVKELTAQKWVAYNITDPVDQKRIAVFCFSKGKFATFLENELTEAEEEDLLFYDVTAKDGRTLRVRFSTEKYLGRSFLSATRIDFLPRKSMDEDKVFAKTVTLDKIFDEWDYDRLKSEFFQSDDDDDEDDESLEDADQEDQDDLEDEDGDSDDELGDSEDDDLEDDDSDDDDSDDDLEDEEGELDPPEDDDLEDDDLEDEDSEDDDSDDALEDDDLDGEMGDDVGEWEDEDDEEGAPVKSKKSKSKQKSKKSSKKKSSKKTTKKSSKKKKSKKSKKK